MKKINFKKVTSLLLAAVMCVTTFAGIGTTTAFAAETGEVTEVYQVDFPRSGDPNSGGNWGYSGLR